MTEQYGQQTINQEGNFRRITEADVDTTLATAAVVLGPGDQYILCDGTGPYQVNLPREADCAGIQIVLKGASTLVAAVTVASAEYGTPPLNSDTFDAGVSPLGALVALDTAIVQGDPALAPVAPAVVGLPSNNWSIISPVAPPA